MSDQNRLLIAAALMAVVLFVSWQFMGKAPRTTQAPQQREVPDTVAVEEGKPPEDTPDDPVAAKEERGYVPEDRTVYVLINDGENDIVRARISSSSASVTDWELLMYEDLPGENTGANVNFNGNSWLDHGEVFTSTAPDTVKVDTGPVTVEFADMSGSAVVRYTFEPGFYGFLLEREGLDENIVLNGGILPVSETDANMRDYFRAQWNAEKVRSRKSGDIELSDQIGNVEWIASRSKYFGILILPMSFERAYGYVYTSELEGSASVGISDNSVKVYAGPLDYGRLRSLGRNAHLMVDFGWPVIRDIGRLLFWFCTAVISIVTNWGLKIIILALVLKLALMPLTTKSFRSMAKLKQVQPKMKELQQRHKNDPKALQAAMQKLYREEGVNPLGGCMPLLMQMPVFFALYRVLANSVQLRGADFMLWIDDLSRPEILVRFENPILGLDGIGLLAVLMGLAMFIQQKMTMTDQSQKGMMYIMPVFMTYLFMRFPAGLTLYWFVNNLLTIGHQQMINRKLQAENSV